MKFSVCPGCLRKGFDTYCKKCAKKMFAGKKVSHHLNFTRKEFDEILREGIIDFSIPGERLKYSLRLENDELIPATINSQFILKPIPNEGYKNAGQFPANEHLTMQIAAQVYKIKTAGNALTFFADGEIAYLTRRFDVIEDNKKLHQEDFAQLSQRTEEFHGKNYKYDLSYEVLADFIKQYVNAYPVQIEKYFRLIVFNYLFSNGDSHLKSFSLYKNELYGDYLLTPFYNLMNTSLHMPERTDTALSLFKGDYKTESFKEVSKYTKTDFKELAQRIGIKEIRYNKILNEMVSKNAAVKDLIKRSLLEETIKEEYQNNFLERLERLK